MKAFARLIALAAALMLLIAMPRAFAEEIDGDCVYTLVDESGRALTRRGGKMYVGDEYISGDDRYYRIISVDDVSQTATAEDLGSTNGTLVNGRRITRQPLSDGDVIRIGHSVLVYRQDGA